MKVLHLSTSDLEGGAARAAYRLFQGLRQAGVEASMRVQKRVTADPQVHGPLTRGQRALSAMRPGLDLLPRMLFWQTARAPFSVQWFPDEFGGSLDLPHTELVHLHWINKGFVRIESLARWSQPLVWTLHDMWPMTGGCHHSGECLRFQVACGACPVLGSEREKDLSRWVIRRKQRAWKNVDLTVVAPSRWIAERARRSALFRERRVEVIANGLDLERFRPLDRQQARRWLNLPESCHLVLFSAIKPGTHPYKGFELLPAVMGKLAELDWQRRIELVILGGQDPQIARDWPVRTHFLGHLHDEISLALAYAAVDVFVAPSHQDNLPNTILEALACGTPSVAYAVGGIPDLIDHHRNGYLAPAGELEALASGIAWVLADAERYTLLAEDARAKAKRDFDLHQQTRRYLDLYHELLERKRAHA